MLNQKKMYIVFLILFLFELTIQNVYLLQLLREKVKRIKSIIFSCKVTPLVYYLSRLLGDIIFNATLYAIIYWALLFGAKNLIREFDMQTQYLSLWGLLFIWKLRYIFISYLLSHFITGSIDQVLKYYMYIYALINGGFVALAIYYPRLPFDYVFDAGTIWLYTFQTDYKIDWTKEIASVFVNMGLALFVSTLLDNYRLNRNFWKQSKGRKQMGAKIQPQSKKQSLNYSFQSDSSSSFNSRKCLF